MKNDKSHRGHTVHKKTGRPSQSGESVEKATEQHLVERGHGGIIDAHPGVHFMPHHKASSIHGDAEKRLLGHQARHAAHHEVEKMTAIPGVVLEIQPLIKQVPADQQRLYRQAHAYQRSQQKLTHPQNRGRG